MSDAGALRASDAERERAAAEIRDHYAEGRLDDGELAERLGRVYASRTRGELQAIRADLPALPPTPAVHRAELAARRSDLTRQLLQQTGAGLAPFLVCTAIWLLAGADGAFWPAWLLLIAAIPLVRNGWRLYGPAPDVDRVAHDLADRRGERARHREERRSRRRSR
jgi:hypothetical protein